MPIMGFRRMKIEPAPISVFPDGLHPVENPNLTGAEGAAVQVEG
jgi:hypothetical protein